MPSPNSIHSVPRVLIIEDDSMIAEMMHEIVHDLGYTVTSTVHRLSSALTEISKENFDGALVNIGVDEERHGMEIADILTAKDIPFGFVTGYSHAQAGRHQAVPLLEKPFSEDQLRNFLIRLVGPGNTASSTLRH